MGVLKEGFSILIELYVHTEESIDETDFVRLILQRHGSVRSIRKRKLINIIDQPLLKNLLSLEFYIRFILCLIPSI